MGDNECAALVCKISLGESPEVYAPPAPTTQRQRMMLARASKSGKARAEEANADAPERDRTRRLRLSRHEQDQVRCGEVSRSAQATDMGRKRWSH